MTHAKLSTATFVLFINLPMPFQVLFFDRSSFFDILTPQINENSTPHSRNQKKSEIYTNPCIISGFMDYVSTKNQSRVRN